MPTDDELLTSERVRSLLRVIGYPQWRNSSGGQERLRCTFKGLWYVELERGGDVWGPQFSEEGDYRRCAHEAACLIDRWLRECAIERNVLRWDCSEGPPGTNECRLIGAEAEALVTAVEATLKEKDHATATDA